MVTFIFVFKGELLLFVERFFELLTGLIFLRLCSLLGVEKVWVAVGGGRGQGGLVGFDDLLGLGLAVASVTI